MTGTWRLRLAAQVEVDLREIALWTTRNFGARQADDYLETVMLAIDALYDGPDILGARSRDEIAPGIRTLHIARRGRKGRHFVVFRLADGQTIDVVRLLHDSMELAKNLAER